MWNGVNWANLIAAVVILQPILHKKNAEHIRHPHVLMAAAREVHIRTLSLARDGCRVKRVFLKLGRADTELLD